jgi:hypothetical protein
VDCEPASQLQELDFEEHDLQVVLHRRHFYAQILFLVITGRNPRVFKKLSGFIQKMLSQCSAFKIS